MMGIIESLQYIGSAFILSSQYIRAQPKYIYYSFIMSLVGSAVLFVYSLYTAQYGYVTLNMFSILMAIIGIINWGAKLKKSSPKDSTETKQRTYIEYVD